MGLFEKLGREVEEFKQNAKRAADEARSTGVGAVVSDSTSITTSARSADRTTSSRRRSESDAAGVRRRRRVGLETPRHRVRDASQYRKARGCNAPPWTYRMTSPRTCACSSSRARPRGRSSPQVALIAGAGVVYRRPDRLRHLRDNELRTGRGPGVILWASTQSRPRPARERTVADMIVNREEPEIHAALAPDSLTSYVMVEADDASVFERIPRRDSPRQRRRAGSPR